MKFNNIMIYGFAGICLTFSSCGKDNYAAPNAGIQGKITDAVTNASFQTAQPNGVKIRLIEESYGTNMTPIDFWCSSDGSFANTALFADKYKIIPIEGAFFPADTTEVTINGMVTVNFKITPFITLTATAIASIQSVITTYTISRTQVGGKIMACKTLVSSVPSVSTAINEFNVTHDLSGITDQSILSSQYSDTVTGLTSGKTYYVRVAAIAANPNNKYNYSEVFIIKIP